MKKSLTSLVVTGTVLFPFLLGTGDAKVKGPVLKYCNSELTESVTEIDHNSFRLSKQALDDLKKETEEVKPTTSKNFKAVEVKLNSDFLENLVVDAGFFYENPGPTNQDLINYMHLLAAQKLGYDEEKNRGAQLPKRVRRKITREAHRMFQDRLFTVVDPEEKVPYGSYANHDVSFLDLLVSPGGFVRKSNQTKRDFEFDFEDFVEELNGVKRIELCGIIKTKIEETDHQTDREKVNDKQEDTLKTTPAEKEQGGKSPQQHQDDQNQDIQKDDKFSDQKIRESGLRSHPSLIEYGCKDNREAIDEIIKESGLTTDELEGLRKDYTNTTLKIGERYGGQVSELAYIFTGGLTDRETGRQIDAMYWTFDSRIEAARGLLESLIGSEYIDSHTREGINKLFVGLFEEKLKRKVEKGKLEEYEKLQDLYDFFNLITDSEAETVSAQDNLMYLTEIEGVFVPTAITPN